MEATGNGPSNFMYELCMEKYFSLSTKIGEIGRSRLAMCLVLSFLRRFLIRSANRLRRAYKMRCLCATFQ